MFEQVLRANFDAVALLRCGHYRPAMTLLTQALTVVQQTTTDPYQAPSPAPMRNVISVVLHDDDNEDQDAQYNPRMLPSSQLPYAEIFQRGFIVETGHHAALTNSDQDASLCACVCLYNMALLMHLKGLQTDGGGLSHLHKACRLYQKVFALLVDLAPEPTDSMINLLLATLLNLIACQGELVGNHSPVSQEYKAVYNNFFEWATSCSPSSSSEKNTSLEEDEEDGPRPAIYQQAEDFDFFAASTIFFHNENLATSPAA